MKYLMHISLITSSFANIIHLSIASKISNEIGSSLFQKCDFEITNPQSNNEGKDSHIKHQSWQGKADISLSV